MAAVSGAIGIFGVYAGWLSYSYPVDGGTVTIYWTAPADVTGRHRLAVGIGG